MLWTFLASQVVAKATRQKGSKAMSGEMLRVWWQSLTIIPHHIITSKSLLLLLLLLLSSDSSLFKTKIREGVLGLTVLVVLRTWLDLWIELSTEMADGELGSLGRRRDRLWVRFTIHPAQASLHAFTPLTLRFCTFLPHSFQTATSLRAAHWLLMWTCTPDERSGRQHHHYHKHRALYKIGDKRSTWREQNHRDDADATRTGSPVPYYMDGTWMLWILHGWQYIALHYRRHDQRHRRRLNSPHG